MHCDPKRHRKREKRMKNYTELAHALKSKSFNLLSRQVDAEFAADVYAAADAIEALMRARDFYANYGKPVYKDMSSMAEARE